MTGPRRGPRAEGRVAAASARRLLLTGIVIAILLGYVGPVRSYLDQRADLSTQRHALAELEAQRAQVSRRLRALEDPAVLEVRARELQLVRPGERIFIVEGLPPPAPPAPPAREDRGLLERIADLF